MPDPETVEPHPIIPQSAREEQLNTLSHALALLFAALACAHYLPVGESGQAKLVSLVYGLSVLQLFTISTLYHALPKGRLKGKFRRLDHCSIFIMIAGSYLPFMTVALGTWQAYAL